MSAHARRWQAQPDGVAYEPSAVRKPAGGGFVAASASPLPAAAAAAVRLELHVGATHVELHWPIAHTRELAACLRELGR